MIQLNDVSIGYNGIPILEHITRTYEDNKIYGLLAKSGTGKTTLLKTIAGLLKPISGDILIENPSPMYKGKFLYTERSPVYMMNQRYSNFAWLTCVDNVLIAQRDKKLRQREAAMAALEKVGLAECADKFPSQLSGGMQQRLSLARTLYVSPRYLLMDEPLSALDDTTRSKMQQLILDVHATTNNTIIMVTHSQDEAVRMCDEIDRF